MNTNRKWYKGLTDPVIVALYSCMFLFDIVVVFLGFWHFALAASSVPFLTLMDHVIWNVSNSEEKYYYTGAGCGFRMLFLK